MQRTIVCLVALAILAIRMPRLFIWPEFWAEDAILIAAAYNHGASSLLETLGGSYFNLYGSIITYLAVQLPPVAWPAVTTYASFAADIFTVFIVMSPRFDMPLKPIAALAVVATPIQDAVFGGLANAQWILPIALFVFAFCRAHTSKYALSAEAVATSIIGLNGPLGCFLVPIYVYRAYVTNGVDRKRLLILGSILIMCAAIQMLAISQDLRVFALGEPFTYSKLIWITMPLRWFDAIRLAGIFVHSMLGPIVAIAIIGAAFWFSLKEPYRDMKLAMLFFAAIILYAGMIKFRHGLYLFTNDRYVYVGSVFFFWYLCVLSINRKAVASAAIVLVAVSVFRRANEPRPSADIVWATQSEFIGSSNISIPIAPNGVWFLRLAAKN